MKLAVSIGVLLLAAAAAQAQTVWRCGPEGRSFSDTPCVDGRPLAAAPDTRNKGDVESSRDVLARDRALAQSLVEQRHEREREVRANGSGLTGFGHKPHDEVKPKVAKSKSKKKQQPEANGIWPAVAVAFRRRPG